VQSREGELHLGLDPGHLGDSEAGRLPRAVLQEGRLADPRLPANHEDGALATADVVEQPVEHLALTGAAQQHRRASGGHPALSLNDQGRRGE
jgi:hypothetical protein